jgi:aromatic ring hydroxylase
VNPETKDLLNKYITRNPDIDPEDAAQLWRYISDILCSASGGVHLIGAYHGGGSPIMEAIAITTQYDIESRKKMVRKLAGIPGRPKKP